MRRRGCNPALFTALIFILGGLYLVAPFVLMRHRFVFVEGVVRGVHLHPLDDRRVAVVYRFSFRVDDAVLPDFEGTVQAFGVGRCDIIGRPVEEPVFDADDPLLQSYVMVARDAAVEGRRGMVYYRADDPLATARINLAVSTRRLAIGIAMLLTPMVVLLCRVLMGLVSGKLLRVGPPRPEPATDRQR